jgi:hypothetical protein
MYDWRVTTYPLECPGDFLFKIICIYCNIYSDCTYNHYLS